MNQMFNLFGLLSNLQTKFLLESDSTSFKKVSTLREIIKKVVVDETNLSQRIPEEYGQDFHNKMFLLSVGVNEEFVFQNINLSTKETIDFAKKISNLSSIEDLFSFMSATEKAADIFIFKNLKKHFGKENKYITLHQFVEELHNKELHLEEFPSFANKIKKREFYSDWKSVFTIFL